MFDSIDLEKALSDIYNVGVDDDALVLLHKANQEVDVAVKNPNGLTERQKIRNIILQGDTFGSILASVQVESIGRACIEAGHGYKYKQKLQVGFLGLVDDIIGITEAGSKAQMLNAFLSIKTAEKTLQFGTSKCKYMIVGKHSENIVSNDLVVDAWSLSYSETGNILEKYVGETPIDRTEQQKYLGFIISNTGNNMVNISAVKKKSFGIIQKILSKLKSLKLRKYYFEGALILMLSMLRPSILYASETYYNLKETEIRHLERIEEDFLRKILKTGKGCPISQLYLELGVYPARFEIQKLRLLFLKYILDQNENSLVKQFFDLQINQPRKGDWASQIQSDLKQLNITESLEELKSMTHSKFKGRIKSQILIKSLEYLLEKRKRKGKEIIYQKLEMAEYLQPINSQLNIENKRKMFAIRNRMVNIKSNFKQKNEIQMCICGQIENMEHIWNCEKLSSDKNEKRNYQKIFNGNIKEQIQIFEEFTKKLERYKEQSEKNTTPRQSL